ncbi:sodium:solute symporter family protein [Paracidobacterium acidisoli]|nr:sodium:solute symporter family protein [Paracidobacterium acidisoli]MBT9332694.1 sodium:solute symporter family protein [Paracidobacterium acidisoli]
MNLYLTALIVYSVFLMALGLFISRRVKTSSDFLVAGRSFGPGMLFATFLAANIGAGSTVNATGLGFRYGLSAWWWVGAAGIGGFFLAQLLGPRLWLIAKEHNLSTMGDYLEFRYNKAVKAVIAILLWVGTLALLAAQLIAISTILNVSVGTPKWLGCLIGGIVAIVYCTAGGLVSSAFVNIFELIVTLSGLVLAVPFALHALGGWTHVTSAVAAQPGRRFMLSITGVGLRQILGYIAILTPSFIISPGLVQKLYGAKDVKTVRIGITVNAVAQLLFAFVPAILGICVFVAAPHLASSDLALPAAMKMLLPAWLGMWAMASIFSAELSATGAILFMLSTSLAIDLYKTFLNPNVTERRLLTANRLASVFAGLAGILFAIQLPNILAAVQIFYGLLSVSLFVPVIAGLYSRRVLSSAALSSIAAALVATLASMRLTNGQGWWILSPPAIGILTSAIVMLAFRILHPAPAALSNTTSVETAK